MLDEQLVGHERGAGVHCIRLLLGILRRVLRDDDVRDDEDGRRRDDGNLRLPLPSLRRPLPFLRRPLPFLRRGPGRRLATLQDAI